ncbi:hypothetical protein D3C78_919330 [compost metagenome]
MESRRPGRLPAARAGWGGERSQYGYVVQKCNRVQYLYRFARWLSNSPPAGTTRALAEGAARLCRVDARDGQRGTAEAAALAGGGRPEPGRLAHGRTAAGKIIAVD